MTAQTQTVPGTWNRSSEAPEQGGLVLPTHEEPLGVTQQPLTVDKNVDLPELPQCLVHSSCDGRESPNVQR